MSTLLFILLQIVAIIVLAFGVICFAHWWTEGRDEYKPQWLNYKPFNCKICLTFWTLLVLYITIGYALELKVFLYGGILFAISNAGAMLIDQKNNTINIDNYDDKR